MQKHVNLVDLVKSFPTNIFLQNLASIQKRTSPIKFAHLAEKSGKGSISNLSIKAQGVEAVEERRETLRDQIEAFTSHANLGNLEEMQKFPPEFRVDLASRRGDTALFAAVRGRKVIIAAFSLDSAVTREVIIQLE